MKKLAFHSFTTRLLRLLIPAYDLVVKILDNTKLLKDKRFTYQIFYRYLPLTFFFVWLFSLPPSSIGSLLYISLTVLGSISIYYQSKPDAKYKNTLTYYILLYIGFMGVRSFVGHTLMADYVAGTIGWESGSPFQIELAFYHLGLAVSAIYYLWHQTKELAFGLVVSKSVFLYGAMAVHFYHLLVFGNTSLGNIGIQIIFGDVVLPTIMLYLLYKSES